MGSGVPKTLEIKPGNLLIENDHFTGLVFVGQLGGKSMDEGEAGGRLSVDEVC